MKMIYNVMSIGLCVKREVCERVMVLVTYGAETWSMRIEQRCKLDVKVMKCLWSEWGMTRMVRW